jgi:uncharacterized membrane protein YbjE (DUF340 family)
MGPTLTILTIFATVGVGLLLSRIPVLGSLSATRAFHRARTALLCAMVAAMGFRIGRTEEVLRNAGTLGIASLAFAAATLAGSILVLAAAFALRGLLGMIGAGFLAGWRTQAFPGANGESLVTALLYVLLAVVGLGLGRTGMPGLKLQAHPDLLVVPLATAIGSLAGGLGAGLALGLRPGPALSVAAGFGWYSLSGVILTRLDSPGLGAISFLSNLLRESAALVLIPLLARTRFPLVAIGAGGATSMDVTLPLIEKNCGARAVPFAIASGGILSLAVPFLVPLLHSIGGP